MTTVAVIIDGLQMAALPTFLGGSILDFVAIFVFAIWFRHYDVNFLSGKHTARVLATIGVELIPFVNSYWWWTSLVRRLIKTERARAERAKQEKAAQAERVAASFGYNEAS